MGDLNNNSDIQRLYHDSIALNYDKWFVEPLPYRLLYKECLDLIIKQSPDKTDLFLEIGAGTGALTVPLRNEGRTIIAIDISLNMLDKLRLKKADIPIIQADTMELPIRSGSVKNVIISETLHHLIDRSKFFTEIRRVLAKEGKVFIFEPQKLIYGLDWIRRIIRCILLHGKHSEYEEPIKREGVACLLKRHGFLTFFAGTTFFFPIFSRSKLAQKIITSIWYYPAKLPVIKGFGGVAKIIARKLD